MSDHLSRPNASDALGAPQAVIRIVPRGGARTAKQILNQWMYLCRSGEMPLQRCERHLGLSLKTDQLKMMAESWVTETGYWRPGRGQSDGVQQLTTHIVVSFPIGTNVEAGFAAGRAWAEEMFGSGRNGGTFDYVTACHADRPHPHVHLVLNRRALEGHWLKISRRHPQLNYVRLRSVLAEVAGRYGIDLQATSRSERGITQVAPTYAEYRRRARAAVATGSSSHQ